ncbi:hypothetical protein F5Y09DRAFT_357307 [Xylaria sp. FL1042]|nr:hypothetical protein F5Y09DRAFT_357307 [Xylaria sp. FL1042]
MLTGVLSVFKFWSDGLSVARSAFGFPYLTSKCIPYEYIISESTGFFSGDILVVNPSSRPKFTITVNDTEPIFFYCSTTNSCKGNRMIGVINPNSSWTLHKQGSFINPSILELQPGVLLPSEFNGTEPPSLDTQYSYETPPLSTGEIAGIAISSVTMLLIVVSLVYICRRQRRLEEDSRQNRNSYNNNIPFLDSSSPQGGDDNTPQSPMSQNNPGFTPAQHPNSGHWSLNSALTSPCRNSFAVFRPSDVSDVRSEVLLGHYQEHQRFEMPGSPVLPAELPADDKSHIPRDSLTL